MLKKKRDHMKAKFHAMLKEIIAAKKLVASGLKETAFSFAKAQWACAGADISSTILERVGRPAITCRLAANNIAGVQIPDITMVHDRLRESNIQTLGISQGGAVVSACRDSNIKLLQAMTKLASLQTSFMMLDEELKMTSRRVNALEYVLMPKLQAFIDYIVMEMDEEAREEFYRVKAVVKKKRQWKEKEERENEERKSAEIDAEALIVPSMFDASRDPDLFF